MALLYTKALHSNIKNISPAYIKVHFSLGQSYVMHSQPKQPKDWRELDPPSQDSDHTWLACNAGSSAAHQCLCNVHLCYL